MALTPSLVTDATRAPVKWKHDVTTSSSAADDGQQQLQEIHYHLGDINVI